jgi:hypothetical protein
MENAHFVGGSCSYACRSGVWRSATDEARGRGLSPVAVAFMTRPCWAALPASLCRRGRLRVFPGSASRTWHCLGPRCLPAAGPGRDTDLPASVCRQKVPISRVSMGVAGLDQRPLACQAIPHPPEVRQKSPAKSPYNRRSGTPRDSAQFALKSDGFKPVAPATGLIVLGHRGPLGGSCEPSTGAVQCVGWGRATMARVARGAASSPAPTAPGRARRPARTPFTRGCRRSPRRRAGNEVPRCRVGLFGP